MARAHRRLVDEFGEYTSANAKDVRGSGCSCHKPSGASRRSRGSCTSRSSANLVPRSKYLQSRTESRGAYRLADHAPVELATQNGKTSFTLERPMLDPRPPWSSLVRGRRSVREVTEGTKKVRNEETKQTKTNEGLFFPVGKNREQRGTSNAVSEELPHELRSSSFSPFLRCELRFLRHLRRLASPAPDTSPRLFLLDAAAPPVGARGHRAT